MAIEAIKGAGMVYQGSTSTAQIKEQAQGRTEVSSADNQVVSDSIARNIQAMNTKETSGDSAGDAGAQGQAQLAAQKQNEKNMQLKRLWMISTRARWLTSRRQCSASMRRLTA